MAGWLAAILAAPLVLTGVVLASQRLRKPPERPATLEGGSSHLRTGGDG